ncbi:hypothetical protein ABID21_001943 [Pseudorhizobium tarimense]|uniref:Uncharacterized protein n=1 Tax=Pseudorhizobium tarimense TaxID=1079109 RepID=A0ABV2H5Z1_9HYPH|nr:hypothetical protein [Pseudorhizobium tarimense]MCJ8519035.1 hypothetical protein [Pseudorhizobium tarimense]
MLAFLLSPIGKALGAAVVAVAIVSGSFLYGKNVGRQGAAVDALERSVEVLRERNEINDEVSASDAAALCGDYGLSDDDERECVRRLGEASAEPGDVGDDPEDGSAVR